MQLRGVRRAITAGRALSFAEVQNLRVFGENQGVEAFATAAGGEQALPEALGVVFRLGMELASAIDCGVGQTDDEAPDHSQNPHGVRAADAAQILLQGDVEAVVQPALDDPVFALQPQQPSGLQLIERAAADEIHDLALPISVTFGAGLQAGHQARPWEAGLAGSHLDAVQKADLTTPAVVLPGQRPGPRRRPRGKRAVRRTAFAGSF